MNNRLIVVLGMHRSGTSVTTRALQVLGVELGDRLMPPIEGNNTKGFFEDLDINALNIEILQAIRSDWHYLSPITSADIGLLRQKGFQLRATETLRKKIGNLPLFGFKDPRVTKLLPFWKNIFDHCKIDVSYVISIRNPINVCYSLERRNQFDFEKGYLLWLEHVVNSLRYTEGKHRLLVDYDSLINNPDMEIARIAEKLQLTINSEELGKFKSEFIDEKLRHFEYQPNDLILDTKSSPIVRDVYLTLHRYAKEQHSLEDSSIELKVKTWAGYLEVLRMPLRLVDIGFEKSIASGQAVAERDQQIVYLNQAVAERDQQIVYLNQAVAERDQQIVYLNQAVAERDQQIVYLNQAVAERDQQIVYLNQAVAERDQQIAYLNQAVVERDQQIVCLNLSITEREKAFSQQLQEIQQVHEQQMGEQSREYTEREQSLRTQLTLALQQTEIQLLEQTNLEKTNFEQLQATLQADQQALNQDISLLVNQINDLQKFLQNAEQEKRIVELHDAQLKKNELTIINISVSWRLFTQLRKIIQQHSENNYRSWKKHTHCRNKALICHFTLNF